MPLPLTFKLLVNDYRGDEETPRSAQFAEFICEGPPKCSLVIHRTLHTEFVMGAFYDATFSDCDGNVKLPILFPNFLFKCSHVDFSPKMGEHAHLVADTGLNPQPATANFWNVARGTFEKGRYYGMLIDFGIREADPEILAAIRDGKKAEQLVDKIINGPQPVALPPENFLTTTMVGMQAQI